MASKFNFRNLNTAKGLSTFCQDVVMKNGLEPALCSENVRKADNSVSDDDFVVFDLEIAKPVVPGTKGKDWSDARLGKLGISVVCVWDSTTDRYRFYDEGTLDDCRAHLEAARTVVSFNGADFDIPCLSGVLGVHVRPRSHYDILQEVWSALGPKQKGYGLGPISERTLGRSKSGSGERAPDLFKAGRFSELYTYCMDDVALTRDLFLHIMETGYIIDTSGDKLCLRTPELLEELNGSPNAG